MFKSILIAMDDSASSKSALDIGMKLAKSTGALVKGLYVEDILRLLEWQPVELIGAAITTSPTIPHGRKTFEQVEVEKEFLEEGNKLKELFKFTKNGQSIEGKFLIIRGKIDETISEVSKTVDLVVIGRRGSNSYPLELSEPGPTTETLLRTTTKPVVVVPPQAKLSSKILIAYDGSKTSQRALSTAAELATILPSSEIRIVSVADDIDTAEKPLEIAREFLSPYKLKAEFLVDFGYTQPWKPIMEQAKNFKAGLIVLGAFGENKLLEMIFGSTTKQVLMQAKCPVLLSR